MRDNRRLPTEVISAFLNDKWAMSAVGRQYHNLAIDEGHECLILNKPKCLPQAV